MIDLWTDKDSMSDEAADLHKIAAQCTLMYNGSVLSEEEIHLQQDY